MPTKKQTQVVIPPEGIQANVIENVDGKRITYPALITENENQETDTQNESEINFDGIENFDEYDETESGIEAPTIPKTQLETMFDYLRIAITQGAEDRFFAQVIRMPDSIGAAFRSPCSTQMDLGVFQFTSRDQFNFQGAIQKQNNDSGGFFNVRIYKSDQTALEIRKRYTRETKDIQVGLLNYSVPNPVKPDAPAIGAPVNQMDNIIMQRLDKTDERFEMLLREMGKPKEKSTLEIAMEQKMVELVMSPPSSSGGPDALQATMIAMFTAPEMAKKMIERAFPETPLPAEPDLMEKVTRVLEIPAVGNTMQGVIGGLSQISQDYFNRKTQTAPNGNAPHSAPAPAPAADQPDEMTELFADLIDELESDNPLDGNNEFLKELETTYPTHAKRVQGICKGFDFESTLGMLIEFTAHIQPHPFDPFVMSVENGQIIWNERGMKMINRLREFHEFVRAA